MTQCPICQTEIKDQDYCPACAWEFEYYFDELNKRDMRAGFDSIKLYIRSLY